MANITTHNRNRLASCFINRFGKLQEFAVCSVGSHFTALFAYDLKKFRPVGMAMTYFVDGVEQDFGKPVVFFDYR